jgi:uncharacterized protein
MASSLSQRQVLTRRQVLGRTLRTGSLVVGGSLLWEGLREAHAPQVTKQTIFLPHLPASWDGLRIAHLSDLHIQRAFPGAALAPTIDLLRELRPDIIALTGDYVVEHHEDKDVRMQECVEALRTLPKIATLGSEGVFASFGNHDFPSEPNSKTKIYEDPEVKIWQAAKITPLLNCVVALSKGTKTREKLYIGGLRSLVMRPTDPKGLLQSLPTDATKILLWHEPDGATEAAGAGASLMLSGHTHGGQIIVPGYGPLLRPKGGEQYNQGIFAVQQMHLYVTRGIGLLPPLLRIGCPPEVTLLTLRRLSA